MNPEITLETNLCGVRLPNPTLLASGILGTSAALLERVARAGAGAVTAKSASLEPRAGHPNPTVISWEAGLLNAVGLANPGATAQAGILRDARSKLATLGVPLIASVFGGTSEEFAGVAQVLAEAEPDFLELNISCPNVGDEFGRPFAADPQAAAEVTRAVKAVVDVPVIVKLSPNVADIAGVARAVEEAGADAIAAINTVRGMAIDVRAARPVLANRFGGLSGPAIKPVAVRCVFECFAAVSIPIIGIGGVSNGLDAAEMMMAGATAVGIGSAVYQNGPEVFARITHELATFMTEESYRSVKEMRGAAHK
ncbi:MAG: dihydroorotate dehydrogenase [Chloroflexi bacterium]|nr:dihydroorotate dehydrogenase [Chloroflexota bacterium]